MATQFVDPRYQYQPGMMPFDPNAAGVDPSLDPSGGGAPADPSNPANPANPSAGMGIYGAPGQPINVTGQYAGTGLDTNPNQDIHNMFYNDQALIAAGGNQINNEVQSQLGYYGPRQQQYGDLADKSLSQLNETPGFNADESAAIGKDYSGNRTSQDDLNKQFLTTGEQQDIFANPYQAQQIMQQGTAAEGAMLNQYQADVGGAVSDYGQNLSGEVGNFQNWTGSAIDQYGNNLDAATGKLDTGLQNAQAGFSKLDAAVNNPGLAFDPNSTEKQMTDADVQNIKTAAGERVGNEYRSAVDDLNRRAAAAGNTSPLAIAAARARLEAQSAAGSGSAEYQADIAAKQAQFMRAADIEGQREGAVKTQTGFKAGAATQEQAQAQNAAALAGTAGIGAAETFGQAKTNAAEASGQAGINAANAYGNANIGAARDYGQFSTNAVSNMANQNTAAAQTADQQASQRAAAIAANRQNTVTGINQTQYGQGVQTQQLNSQGQQTIGNARIAGQGAYRAGVAQQQGMAQQGGQTAIGQQLGAYGTETQGLNQSTAARAGYENSGTGFGRSVSGAAGKFIGSGAGLFSEGGIVTEPTVAIIGEKNPEMVVPLGRYKQKERSAA